MNEKTIDIVEIQMRMTNILNSTVQVITVLSGVIAKFGITLQDILSKTDAFRHAQAEFQTEIRKQKRRKIYLRKYRRRGEKMKLSK